MKKGTLYWITGLSGAGKTTIGSRLYYELKKKISNLVILDGDILKNIVGDSVGYSKEERLKRARQYSNICKMLTDQGISVIICTIAMYDSIREWNRNNIERYIEVFLKVDREILLKRDRKGLYSKQQDGQIMDVAGVDQQVEFPKNPDIVIENDGSKSITECVNEILAYQIKKTDGYNRDTAYWNDYYKKDLPELQEPSDFAQAVFPYLKKGKSMIDLGCGNGRDSIFFAQNEISVTGIDASQEAILRLNKLEIPHGSFICDDFVTSKALYQIQYDYLYSRWTLHAISENQETELLKNIVGALRTDGLFFAEMRSINDDLFGKGEKVAENSYIYNGHFRRFINKEVFKKKLQAYGFEILFLEEGTDFSKTKVSNPTLIRVIAKRVDESPEI